MHTRQRGSCRRWPTSAVRGSTRRWRSRRAIPLSDRAAARALIAPDPAKAIALLTTAHPDLVLVDVNGGTLECVDAIRSGEISIKAGAEGCLEHGHVDSAPGS